MTAAKKKAAVKKARPKRRRLTAAERKDKLENDRREKFAMILAANGGNRTEAYIMAGYSETGARQGACRLLTIADVSQRVKFYQRLYHEQLLAEKIDILRETSELAMFDTRNLFDECGHLKHLLDMDDATAKSIHEIEVMQGDDGDVVTKVKFGKDKIQALEKMLKHYNAYEDHQSAGAAKEVKMYLLYEEDVNA